MSDNFTVFGKKVLKLPVFFTFIFYKKIKYNKYNKLKYGIFPAVLPLLGALPALFWKLLLELFLSIKDLGPFYFATSAKFVIDLYAIG